MITKIELTNFKSHAHTVIEPGRVTALVGPNGTGKSSLLRSINLLSQLRDTSLEKIYEYGSSPSRIGRYKSKEIKISISSESADPPWDFATKWTQTGSGRSLGWQVSANWKIGADSPISIEDIRPHELLVNRAPDSFFQLFGESIYFKGASANLAKPSYTDEINPKLSFSGEGLASTYSYLVGKQRDTARWIEDSLKEIVPTVKQIGFRPAKIIRTEIRVFTYDKTVVPVPEQREVMGQELVFDTTSAHDVPADEMSDGTLLILGLLTLLAGSSSSSLILLDDIEAGLHPLAQRQLMQVLKDFAENHDRQIILTSHSPYIVDALDPKDVWVMDMDKEGVSHTKRLSDHPDAKRALGVLTTGELWDAEGESWVLEDTETANA